MVWGDVAFGHGGAEAYRSCAVPPPAVPPIVAVAGKPLHPQKGEIMKRLFSLLLLVLALALVAAACSSGDDAALVAEGKLTVCSEVPYEPFEFEDPAGPSGYGGFDIELMDAIATEMELELVVANTPFDGIWLQPAAGACDVVASAMTITEDRAGERSVLRPVLQRRTVLDGHRRERRPNARGYGRDEDRGSDRDHR